MSSVIIITYDITNNKLRTKFSKFLEKYGVRIQFSVFEIENSKRILDIVQKNVEFKYKKLFEPSDSIYMFFTDKKNVKTFGSANLLDNDLIFL